LEAQVAELIIEAPLKVCTKADDNLSSGSLGSCGQTWDERRSKEEGWPLIVNVTPSSEVYRTILKTKPKIFFGLNGFHPHQKTITKKKDNASRLKGTR
jgi:hypothetical protein